MIKKSFSIAAMLLSTTVGAGQWSDPLTIEELWTEGSSDIIGITTSGGKQYTTNCLTNFWLFNANTEERRARAYSTLIAAQMANKKIKIWYSDHCTSWNYHEGTSVKIFK